MSPGAGESTEKPPNPRTLRARAARHRAVAWLGRREYSVAELATRLQKSGYDEQAVAAAMDWLREHDLVSDERFATALIRSRVNKGYGPLWIRVRLRGKGLADADIQQALDEAGADWRQIAKRAADKRFGAAPCEDLREKSRRYRFLAQRGFAHAQIDYVLAANGRNDDDEK